MLMRMRAGLVLLLSLSLFSVTLYARQGKPPTASSTSVQEKKPSKEMEAFASTWEIVSVKPDGVTRDAKRLVFRADGTYAALDLAGKELWAGTFEIDPNATPKIWDHRSRESQKKQGDVLGIYKIEGDKLTACCVVGKWKEKANKEKEWSGKPRPSEFKLEGADVLLELQRVNGSTK